ITVVDVHQSLSQLTYILEWYFEHERPGPAGAKATGAPAVSAAGSAAGATAPRRPAGKPAARTRWWPTFAGVGVAAVLMGLACLWAAGVFRVKTADGSVLVVEVNEPNPDVFVDGDKV